MHMLREYDQEKRRISESFNKALDTYDGHCNIQRIVCMQLLHELSKFNLSPKNIAEIGCGTGMSTEYLSNNFIDASIYGIDVADKLLNKAKAKIYNRHIQFLHADFDELNFPIESLDLVFSSMTLQWSMELKKTLHTLALQLRKGGILAFNAPLNKTFPELNSHSVNPFHSLNYIVDLLTHAGFEVLYSEETKYIESFSSSLEALRSLKLVGANCLLQHSSQGINGLKSMRNGSKNLTYKIGFFIAQKKEVMDVD